MFCKCGALRPSNPLLLSNAGAMLNQYINGVLKLHVLICIMQQLGGFRSLSKVANYFAKLVTFEEPQMLHFAAFAAFQVPQML